jgi:DNA-binding response OmpR family regulator
MSLAFPPLTRTHMQSEAGGDGGGSSAPRRSPSENHEAVAGRSVLVVDDDVNLTRLLRMILRSAGFEVLTAEDGFAGLEVTKERTPDLIILDLRMPQMDGHEFYRELRNRGIQTPVLIASAYGARAAQRELGAQGAIEKPFDPDRVVEVVEQILDG